MRQSQLEPSNATPEKESDTMRVQPPLIILFAILYCFLTPAWSSGESIETIGEYLVGDGETMSAGAERARQDAIRKAAEQAGAFVHSYSKVRNMVLEEDLIEVVANHAMKITTLPEKREMAGHAIRIQVSIRAEIMEGEIEKSIQRAVQQQEEVTAFQQLQQDFLRQAGELENLKQQLAMATEKGKPQVLYRIGKNERSFKARALVDEGNRLAAHLQFDEAESKFTKAIELDPGLALAYAGRADAALFSGGPNIQKDISTAIDLDPKNPYYYALRGRAVASLHCHGAVQDRCQEVIDDLKRAIKLAPNLPQFHQGLGIIYAAMGRREQAEEEYNLSLRHLKPGPPMVELNAYLGRAEFYLDNGGEGYLQKALSDLDRAVTIIMGPSYLPTDYDKYIQLKKCASMNEQEVLDCISTTLGAKFTDIEDFKKSEFSRKLDQIRKSSNDITLMLWKRSQVRYESGDLKGANADREKCCSFIWQHADIVDRNGIILHADFCADSGVYRPFATPAALKAYQHVQLGIRAASGLHNQRAEQEFTAAIKSDPACFDAYLQRGFLYMSNKSLIKARSDYDHAIAINPASGRAHHERGMVRTRAQDYSGAVEDFTHAFRLDPENTELLRKRAHVYEVLDENEKAAADYLDYARKNSANPEIMLTAADELKRMVRLAEERQLLKEYLEVVRNASQSNPDYQQPVESIKAVEERLRELATEKK